MLKKLILASALSLPFVITTGPAKAFEFPDKPPVGELSANVSYYTNYIWRGEEQTGGLSIQGGFDYSVNLLETYVDAYVGTWAANLNTNGFGMELDYYGGFTGAIPLVEDYLSYDIGMLGIPQLVLLKTMITHIIMFLQKYLFPQHHLLYMVELDGLIPILTLPQQVMALLIT